MTQQSCKLEFGGMLNGMSSGGCVGNAFMRSETPVNIRGLLNGSSFPFFHSTHLGDSHNKTERINPFPTKLLYKLQFDSQLIDADSLKKSPLLVTGGKVY